MSACDCEGNSGGGTELSGPLGANLQFCSDRPSRGAMSARVSPEGTQRITSISCAERYDTGGCPSDPTSRCAAYSAAVPTSVSARRRSIEDEAVVTEQVGMCPHGSAERVDVRASLDRGDRSWRLRKSRAARGQSPDTSARSALAASLPSALPANGLSPVMTLRSWCVAPVGSVLRMVTPSAFSFSPKCQMSCPGM